MLKNSRLMGFIVIFLAYVGALGIGLAAFQNLLPVANIYLRILFADAAATVFVYLVGLIVGNTSVYDPYWSVAPIIILPLCMIYFQSYSWPSIFICSVIALWGLRLTNNWITTFTNLNAQDWRYDMLKQKTKGFYPLVSLLGINLFPTVIVFGVICPIIALIIKNDNIAVNPMFCLGSVISVLALLIESLADRQMRDFRKTNRIKGKIIDVGLWKYARHPNYFGEIIFWWGAYAAMVAYLPELWFLGLGALANTLMFLFISIPMAERRLAATKMGFAAYKKRTNSIWLLPLRHPKNEEEEQVASR